MNGMLALLKALQDMMTTDAGMFLSDGLDMFRYAAIIAIVLMGIKFQHSGDFVSLLWMILRVSFCALMVWYYINPIPGYGHSFTYLLTAPSQDYASRLSNGSANDLMSLLDTIAAQMEAPEVGFWLNVRHIMAYVGASVSIWFFQAVLLLVIGVGYFAVAMYLMVGPIIIPFFIVPGMDWMFWGWLKSLIIFSFYQVFAYAFINVYGKLIINFCTNHPPPFDAVTLVASSGAFVILLLAGIGTALAIPVITASMFSGGGGVSSWLGKFWR